MASEDKKAEGKPEGGENPLQAKATSALSYIPRKFAELTTFMSEVLNSNEKFAFLKPAQSFF